MKKMTYPNPAPGVLHDVFDRGLWRRARTAIESWSVRRRELTQREEVPLQCVSAHGQTGIYPDELPLVFVVRNERALLPSFLSYYRTLGVTRFICVDDASTDGTAEFLVAQADVDVWTSSVRYKDAARGRAWRQQLFNLYGRDRWYVNVDADEFLVYANSEERNLWSVVDALDELGQKRLAAPMVDMYPFDLQSAGLDKLADFKPWQVADHFDGTGYELRIKRRAPSLRGGPRRRAFNDYLELMKYPLIFWDEDADLGTSIHQPLPYDRNFIPPMGALLHFKIFSDFENRARLAVEGGQYFNNSAAYRAALSKLETDGELRFADENSVKYIGATQLMRLGFFVEIPGKEK